MHNNNSGMQTTRYPPRPDHPGRQVNPSRNLNRHVKHPYEKLRVRKGLSAAGSERCTYLKTQLSFVWGTLKITRPGYMQVPASLV